MSKRIYIAGPMTGLPEFNYPAFFQAAKKLREQGYEVFSPAEWAIEMYGPKVFASPTGNNAESERKSGFNLRDAMMAFCVYICQHATHIAMLPGWENSKGSQAEHALARNLGLKFIYL